jgi:hypothetical protein
MGFILPGPESIVNSSHWLPTYYALSDVESADRLPIMRHHHISNQLNCLPRFKFLCSLIL